MKSRTAALATLTAMLLATTAAQATHRQPRSGGGSGKPNFVVILADDMTEDQIAAMPRVRELIAGRGVTFEHGVVEVALCAPSRATILTGRYSHNHGVHTCEVDGDPYSGWDAMRRLEDQTLAVWLKGLGYRTAMLGKYTNDYDDCGHVPPGWTTWAAWCGGSMNRGWNYTLSVNGNPVRYGDRQEDFATDVLARRAQAFVRDSIAPYFLLLAPSSGHASWAYPARHAAAFPVAPVPRTPAFAEDDVSDLPSYMQFPPLTPEQIAGHDSTHARSMRSLLSLDEAVGRIVDQVRQDGELDRTYFVFTSDHGYHFGEHRWSGGKQTLFETDVGVPMIWAGPGIAGPRTDREHILGNVDLAPTILRLAGAQSLPATIDGSSAAALLAGGDVSGWRQAMPLAHWYAAGREGTTHRWPTMHGVRTIRWTFGEDRAGNRILFDNAEDPAQTMNLAGEGLAIEAALAALTEELSQCAGAQCREIERRDLP